MSKFIKKLFEKWACSHKWEIHHTSRVFTQFGNEHPTYIERTLICSKCGKITKIEI